MATSFPLPRLCGVGWTLPVSWFPGIIALSPEGSWLILRTGTYFSLKWL